MGYFFPTFPYFYTKIKVVHIQGGMHNTNRHAPPWGLKPGGEGAEGLDFAGGPFSYFLRISKDRKRQQKTAKDSKRQEKEQERTRERKSRGPMGRPVAGVGRPVAAVGGP